MIIDLRLGRGLSADDVEAALGLEEVEEDAGADVVAAAALETLDADVEDEEGVDAADAGFEEAFVDAVVELWWSSLLS